MSSGAGSPPRVVRVAMSERSYDVVIGRGLLLELGARTVVTLSPRRLQRARLVADTNLPRAVVDRAAASLRAAGLEVQVSRLVATEADKSLATVERLLLEMSAARHERWDPVIALGGGITGDVAGFAASIARRGVPVVQCPTTLLAMVDASVGGKTGVNLVDGGVLRKNMVGAFWQPRLVLIDLDTLTSLPERERRAGLAECIKHAMIAGTVQPAEARSVATLTERYIRGGADAGELVAANVQLKATVVQGDEREELGDGPGGRALLNLGHTFGHAIEPLPGLTLSTGATAPLLHGEAIALGLVAAAATSRAMGEAGIDPDATRQLLSSAGLPVSVAGLPDDGTVLAAMMHDKKVEGGRLRLVLPGSGGTARIVVDPPLEAVRAGLAAIRSR